MDVVLTNQGEGLFENGLAELRVRGSLGEVTALLFKLGDSMVDSVQVRLEEDPKWGTSRPT